MHFSVFIDFVKLHQFIAFTSVTSKYTRIISQFSDFLKYLLLWAHSPNEENSCLAMTQRMSCHANFPTPRGSAAARAAVLTLLIHPPLPFTSTSVKAPRGFLYFDSWLPRSIVPTAARVICLKRKSVNSFTQHMPVEDWLWAWHCSGHSGCHWEKPSHCSHFGGWKSAIKEANMWRQVELRPLKKKEAGWGGRGRAEAGWDVGCILTGLSEKASQRRWYLSRNQRK